jgi:hypothetical protein
MPKEHKPGWTYYKSKILNKEYAFHDKTGWVYFEDRVRYSPDEIKIINEAGGIVNTTLHNVKLVFGGEVIKYESGTGTVDKRKSDESGGAKNNALYSSAETSVSKNKNTSTELKSGELGIY